MECLSTYKMHNKAFCDNANDSTDCLRWWDCNFSFFKNIGYEKNGVIALSWSISLNIEKMRMSLCPCILWIVSLTYAVVNLCRHVAHHSVARFQYRIIFSLADFTAYSSQCFVDHRLRRTLPPMIISNGCISRKTNHNNVFIDVTQVYVSEIIPCWRIPLTLSVM